MTGALGAPSTRHDGPQGACPDGDERALSGGGVVTLGSLPEAGLRPRVGTPTSVVGADSLPQVPLLLWLL